MMRRDLNRRLDGLEQREPGDLPASLLAWLGEADGNSRRKLSVVGAEMNADAGQRWLAERGGKSK